MATRIPDAVRNAAADAVVDLLDANASPGYVEIRSGAEMILSSTEITTGGDVTIDSWTVTMPSDA